MFSAPSGHSDEHNKHMIIKRVEINALILGSLEVKENFPFTKDKVSFIIKFHLNIKDHQKRVEIDAVITCKDYFPLAKEVCNRALTYQPAQARNPRG